MEKNVKEHLRALLDAGFAHVDCLLVDIAESFVFIEFFLWDSWVFGKVVGDDYLPLGASDFPVEQLLVIQSLES
jgi:hypothetical protein